MSSLNQYIICLGSSESTEALGRIYPLVLSKIMPLTTTFLVPMGDGGSVIQHNTMWPKYVG